MSDSSKIKITAQDKPLLYILPSESASLQEAVSSAITNDASLNQNNQPNYSLAENMKTAAIAAAVMGANSPVLLPVLFPALGLSLIVNNLQKKATNNDDSQNKESKSDINQVIKNLNLESWSAFIAQISYSSIPEYFEFSPGHPLPGRFYRAHPLKSKKNKYIPIETFDSLLYAERESELIRLLVDLGATKITIQEKLLGKMASDATANIEIKGAGGVKSELKGDANKLNESIRSFSLTGINWTPELKKEFEETAYSWLPYEPAWAAVVHSRLSGKCLTASIELTNDDSYSISGKMGLTEGLLQNLGGFDAGASFTRSQTKTSLISIEFAPSIESSTVNSTK